ncbi:MAG: ECF transporter S component [Hydrogenoanaerobacterium sp.]
MENTITKPTYKGIAKKVVLCGLLIAVGLILPTLIHLSGMPGGPVLLPMHLPVFLAGLLCGGPYGAIVGAVLPILSTLLTGMPKMFPTMPMMTVELAVYGLVSGLIYKKSKRGVLFALVCAMVAGRCANALALLFTGAVLHLTVPPAVSVLSSVILGLPGIIVQLVLVPAVVRLVSHYESK